MALVICCPCGNPIDFEHLELVVTLTCPRCGREIDLEFEDAQANRRRATLTVIEGPHWIGEQFLVPVGVELRIGQAAGNWISLDSEKIAPLHCRLQLTQQGVVVVEDSQSPTGTWIGHQRIARGRLAGGQALRVGDFRFRLDYQNIDGTTIVASPAVVTERSGILPTMASVQPKATPTNVLLRNRFRLARWLLWACGALMGAYHFAALHQPPLDWHWARSAAVAGLVLGAILGTSRHVTLGHRLFKYLPIAVLIVLAVVDMVWVLPAGIVSQLGLAAALAMLIVATPQSTLVVCGTSLGAACMLVGLIAAIKNLAALAG